MQWQKDRSPEERQASTRGRYCLGCWAVHYTQGPKYINVQRIRHGPIGSRSDICTSLIRLYLRDRDCGQGTVPYSAASTKHWARIARYNERKRDGAFSPAGGRCHPRPIHAHCEGALTARGLGQLRGPECGGCCTECPGS